MKYTIVLVEDEIDLKFKNQYNEAIDYLKRHNL